MYSLSKSAADRITLLQPRNIGYPEQVWYVLAAFLFVVGCFEWGSSIHSKFARRRRFEPDEETGANQIHRQYSLRRVPLAFINFYRVVAFRWTLEIRQTYILNMAEVVMTLGYIALLVTYSCINSKPTGLCTVLPTPHSSSQAPLLRVNSFKLPSGTAAWR